MLGASKGLYISNNIFFTLALGILMLNILEQGRSTSRRGKRSCVSAVWPPSWSWGPFWQREGS